LEWPVLSGQIPEVGNNYVPRQEAGLSLAGLPVGGTTVVVPAAGGGAELGGTGKTWLAAALAHEQRSDPEAELVVWVAATGRDAVLRAYAQALGDLGEVAPSPDENPERAAGQFLGWLAGAARPWLVVLDDLADPAAVEGLWPSGAMGRVLVTTERADTAAAAPSPRVAPLGAFSGREALAYLYAELGVDPGQRGGAFDLAADLELSPVALSHAGAFMTATGQDCRQYHARLAERRQALAGAFAGVAGPGVAAAWSLSCDLANYLAPQGVAGRVLVLISLLSPHGVPAAVLTSPAARAYVTGAEGRAADETHVRAAVNNLARAGLVTVNGQSPARTVLVHQVAQALARRHLSATELEAAARAAADAVAQAWMGWDGALPTAQALRECTAKLHQHAGPLLWAPQAHPALLQAGRSLDAEGLAGPAATHWEAMVSTSQQRLGPGHPQTLAAHEAFVAACEASGRLEEAIGVHEAALAQREQALGPEHPDTQDARERLSRSYLAAGRAQDSLYLAKAALADARQIHRPESPEALSAHASLAQAYLAAGQPEEAATALRHVLSGREQVLGHRHPDTIAARVSLADACQQSGRVKEAIALGRRTLADQERTYGADHPDTIAAVASLASAYRSANKRKEALRLYERLITGREHGQGPDHPDTIAARGDLALAYLAAGKLALAVAQYERALTDAERVLGPAHPVTESARQALQEAGDYAWAVLGIDLRTPQLRTRTDTP
jgi:tetratricopeptide (TPR) repeat protein